MFAPVGVMLDKRLNINVGARQTSWKHYLTSTKLKGLWCLPIWQKLGFRESQIGFCLTQHFELLEVPLR